MGKEAEKEWIYVYVWLIHYAVHLKLTQHYKLTILQYKIKIELKKVKKKKKKKDPRELPDPSAGCGPIKKRATYEVGPDLTLNLLVPWSWTSSLQNCEDKCPLRISHPDWGIFTTVSQLTTTGTLNIPSLKPSNTCNTLYNVHFLNVPLSTLVTEKDLQGASHTLAHMSL